jgi:hypothetical protein
VLTATDALVAYARAVMLDDGTTATHADEVFWAVGLITRVIILPPKDVKLAGWSLLEVVGTRGVGWAKERRGC